MPVSGFRIEHHVERKLRQTSFYVTRCSSTVAREDISPVTLCVDEQVFLSHLHEGIANRGIAMRMKLHGVTHDIGHLIISTIIHALHGVQNASLHRLESILDMGHGTLQDDVGSIVEEPVLVHTAEMAHGRCVKSVDRLVIGMLFCCFVLGSHTRSFVY